MAFRIIALVILTAFYACYYGKMFMQRKKGIRTTQVGKGKTELVTNGIFSISRNPAFLGFDLVYLGILLMFFNRVLFVMSVFTAVMFHLQIVNVIVFQTYAWKVLGMSVCVLAGIIALVIAMFISKDEYKVLKIRKLTF